MNSGADLRIFNLEAEDTVHCFLRGRVLLSPAQSRRCHGELAQKSESVS